MKDPIRISDPNSPELILNNLSYGIENNSRSTDEQAGSCEILNNVFITESNALCTIPAYNKYDDYNDYKCLSIPFVTGTIDDTQTSTETKTYIITEKNSIIYLCETKLNGHIIELTKIPDNYFDNVLYRIDRINDQLIIYNGHNYPFLYDLGEKKNIEWKPLPDPLVAPTAETNIAGATDVEKWTIHYTVSFNSTIGATKATPRGQTILGKDIVDMTTDEYFRIIRPEPPVDAVSWNVYLAVEEGANGILYGLNKDPIPITTDRFEYTNSTELLIDMLSPNDNTTNPVVFNFANIINSRLWVTQISQWNGKAYPYTVAWSGTGKECFKFSSSVGGGFVDVELGTSNTTQSVNLFRQNNGETGIVSLTGGATSAGKRFIFEPKAVTYSQQYGGGVQGFAPVEQMSALGTIYGWSVCTVDTQLLFLSQEGIISTNTNKDSFNILSNNNIGLKISKLLNDIHPSQYSKIQVVNHGTRVFWRLFKDDNTPYILCYDYIKNAFSIIDIPIDSLFVDTSIDSELKLGFVLDGRLYYITLDNNGEHKLTSEIELNYNKLNGARTRTTYGRMIDTTVLFEKLPTGEIEFEFIGVNKDDITQHKLVLNDEQIGDFLYNIYRYHHKLYRDKIITDKVKLRIKSTGIKYYINEIHFNFDPLSNDWIKNKFQRSWGDKSKEIKTKYGILQPQENIGKVKSVWIDSDIWDDNLYWND